MANGSRYNFKVLIEKVDSIHVALFGNEKGPGFCERVRTIERKINWFPNSLVAILQVLMIIVTLYFIFKQRGL